MTDLKQVKNKRSSEDAIEPTQGEPENKTAKLVDKEYTLEIIKDFDGKVDIFYLEKQDPNYSYRWIRNKDTNIMAKTSNILDGGGWQLCPRKHLLRIGISEKDLAADGLLRRGDLILAFIPKELADKKQVMKTERANKPISQINRLLAEGDPIGGLQTSKALGFK
jgi:hypothetical protein